MCTPQVVAQRTATAQALLVMSTNHYQLHLNENGRPLNSDADIMIDGSLHVAMLVCWSFGSSMERSVCHV